MKFLFETLKSDNIYSSISKQKLLSNKRQMLTMVIVRNLNIQGLNGLECGIVMCLIELSLIVTWRRGYMNISNVRFC